MNPRTALLVASVAIGGLLPSAASAHGDPDQRNDVPTVMSVSCEQEGQSLFQAFTPSVRLLSAVDLRVRAPFDSSGNQVPRPGVTALVRIVRGLGPGGSVIGTATAVTTAANVPYLLHFDFATPLVLDPPGGFGIELATASAVSWLQTEQNSYSGGTSFACGIPFAARDFLFQTLVPPDERAPETVVARAPQGLVNSTAVALTVSGEDDLTYPADLIYRCTLDGQPLPCTTPIRFRVREGSHTLTIAAVDKAGREDPSPATVAWSVDTTPPPKPVVRGPTVTSSRVATYRFSARGAAGFRCSLDGAPIRRCGSSLRLRLSPGRHVLRVRAIDAAGNLSATTTLQIRVA